MYEKEQHLLPPWRHKGARGKPRNMLKIWYGAEPYLIQSLKAKEEALVENPEFNVIDFGDELDETAYNQCYETGFFTDKKYLVFTTADLKNPYIAKLIENEPENEVRIIVSKFEANLKVAKSLKPEQVQEFKRLSDKDMPKFVKYFLSKWKTNIRETDFNYLITRIGYSGRENCDLYTVKNWLQELFSLDEVTKADIDFVIPPDEKANAFALFKLLSEGEKYFELAEKLLVTEEAIGLLSLLLSNFRIAYKVSIVTGNPEGEIGVPKYRIANIPEETCIKGMSLLQEGVNAIKSGENGRDVFIRISGGLITLLKKRA